MKTFITTWVAIIATLFPTLVFGGLPPTRSGGQSGTLSTTFDFKTPYNQVTKYSGTGGLIETGSYQIAKNPGFEAQTYSTSWATTGGTLAAATSTNIFFSKGATWNSSAASQEFSSDLATVPEGFVGNNCEGSIYIKVPSGTATHTIRVVDNSSNVKASATVINSTYFTKNTLNFPCPASGTSIALQIISVASDEPLIALDEAYLGLARNVGSTDLITEWEAWTPTGVWVSGATYTGFKRRVGTNQEIKFRISLGSAPSGTLALNLPSECVVDTTKVTGNNARVPLGNHLIFDSDTGANIYGTVQAASTTSVSLNVILTGNASTAPISNITATTPITFASGDTIDGYFSVPCVGWAASTTVMPDAQGWFVDATIEGGSPALGSSAQSSYIEITNASLTMTPKSGSAAAGIMCSSTNAAAVPSTSATTCSVGSESLGISTNIPKAGWHEVCVSFNHFTEVNSGAGVNAAFQIVQTPTNAQTITAEGGSRMTSRNAGMTIASGVNAVTTFPIYQCGNFNLSAGIAGFRLMYEQVITGSPVANEILADASAAVGQRNARFTIKPISQQQQATLANSVIARDAVGGQVTTVNTIVSKTTTYTATANDETISASMSGGAWTLSLPAAAGVKGKKYNIVLPDDSVNGLTIDPNSSETICGQATVVLRGLRDTIDIQSDGTNWIGLGDSCWRVNGVRLDCDSGSTIPVDRQRLVSSIGNISGGTCAVTLNTGNYSGAPTCTASWNGTATSSYFYAVCSSNTACAVGGGGAVTTAQIDMTCWGPR